MTHDEAISILAHRFESPTVGFTEQYVEALHAIIADVIDSCDRDGRRAEQVYVNTDTADPHPIEINAWVGYGSVGRMKLTRRQAIDLIGLLAQAVERT